MATLEHEVTHEAAHEAAPEATREISIRLSREQADHLQRAALTTGQSLEGFAVSVLLREADVVLTQRPYAARSLDGVFGIFKDEPLMEALMERIREDRRAAIESEAE